MGRHVPNSAVIMRTAIMVRFHCDLRYAAVGTFGLGCYAGGASLRTQHDAYKVRKLMAAVVQGALEEVGTVEGELRKARFELNVPDIEVVSGDGKARPTSTFRLVGKKVQVQLQVQE